MQVDQLRKLQGDLTTAQNTLTAMQNSPDLQAFDAATTTEIARLQAAIGGNATKVKGEAEGVVAKLITERDTEVARLRKERDDKVDALRIMPGDDIANSYGGQWRKSRGFMDRFRELRGVTESDSASAWIVWGCRLIMVIIGLIIMILKLLAKGSFSNYFNENLQMSAAEPGSELERVAIAKGYTDPVVRAALGYDFKTIAHLDALLRVRITYAEKYREWRTYLLSLCTPLATGFCRTREEIRSLLETKWRTSVETQGDKVVDAEQNLTETGIPVPRWPASLGSNPTDLNRPWDPPVDELMGNGWEDPGPIKDRIRDAFIVLRDARAAFEAVVLEYLDKPLMQAITAYPTALYTLLRARLEPARIDIYVNTLAPMIRNMRDIEQFLTNKGEAIPPWKPAFRHDVEVLERIWLIPSPATLRSDYGWRGQESDRSEIADLPFRRPVPAPVVRPPAPVAPVIPDPAPVDAPPVVDTTPSTPVDAPPVVASPPAPVTDPAPPVVVPTPVEPPVVVAAPVLTTEAPVTPGNGHDTAPNALVPTVECWSCMMDLPADYRFCGFCGSPHDRPAPPTAVVTAPDAAVDPTADAEPAVVAPAAAPTP